MSKNYNKIKSMLKWMKILNNKKEIIIKEINIQKNKSLCVYMYSPEWVYFKKPKNGISALDFLAHFSARQNHQKWWKIIHNIFVVFINFEVSLSVSICLLPATMGLQDGNFSLLLSVSEGRMKPTDCRLLIRSFLSQ